MRNVLFGGLELSLWNCLKLVQADNDVIALFNILKSIGGEVLTFAMDRIHPHPEQEINATGCIMCSLGFGHRFLERDPLWPKKYVTGTASLSYLNDSQTLVLNQSGSSKKPKILASQAKGMLAIASLLYPHLRPRYGWIDEVGENSPSEKEIEATEIKCIFWANFFGPDYVKKYGRDYLLNAPGWKKEELSGDSVLYVVGESYSDWRNNRRQSQETLDYFRIAFPKIKLYRSKGVN